jgi:hypothetical protein
VRIAFLRDLRRLREALLGRGEPLVQRGALGHRLGQLRGKRALPREQVIEARGGFLQALLQPAALAGGHGQLGGGGRAFARRARPGDREGGTGAERQRDEAHDEGEQHRVHGTSGLERSRPILAAASSRLARPARSRRVRDRAPPARGPQQGAARVRLVADGGS